MKPYDYFLEEKAEMDNGKRYILTHNDYHYSVGKGDDGYQPYHHKFLPKESEYMVKRLPFAEAVMVRWEQDPFGNEFIYCWVKLSTGQVEMKIAYTDYLQNRFILIKTSYWDRHLADPKPWRWYVAEEERSLLEEAYQEMIKQMPKYRLRFITGDLHFV